MDIVGWVPQRTDSEICTQKVDWGVLLGATPTRGDGSWIAQKEKLNCHQLQPEFSRCHREIRSRDVP